MVSERLVLLHGFTQTSASWLPIIPLLDARDVVAVDLPGHGTNPERPPTFTRAAELIATEGGPADWCGYSMGARLALSAAMHAPASVRCLIMVGGTPGIEDDAERQARRNSDEALAREVERDGVEVFVDRWLSQPMFSGLTETGRAERLTNTVDGLAWALRTLGTGAMPPLWERLHELSAPTLAVIGSRDEKFAAIADRMASAIPNCTVATVEDAGHAAHLERPEEFAAIVNAFLADVHRASQTPAANNNP